MALLLLPAAALAETGPAEAQNGTGYDMSWWTVDGGAAVLIGKSYSLAGTVGEADAGLLTDGDYTLGCGFWGGGALAVGRKLYLPLVLRRFP